MEIAAAATALGEADVAAGGGGNARMLPHASFCASFCIFLPLHRFAGRGVRTRLFRHRSRHRHNRVLIGTVGASGRQ